MTFEREISDDRRLEPEDEARADFYALLARLYARAPDAPLLAAIAAAVPLAPDTESDAANGIASAWESLRAASALADPVAAADEFQALFVGVGRSEVSLYASHYLGPQSGRPLAQIRATLADLGLARRAELSESSKTTCPSSSKPCACSSPAMPIDLRRPSPNSVRFASGT